MFIQVIHGRAKDAEAINKQTQRWLEELAPGAVGWLGATEGVTDDGEYVAVVRFESRAAADRNSARPEQGEWWNETAQYFDGEVTFHDCDEVDVYKQGGSDDAGFVQVIEALATDKVQARAQFQEMLPTIEQERPDVLGSTMAWHGDLMTQTVFFSSENAAREGEKTMQSDARVQERESVLGDMKFYDLRRPNMTSP